LQWFAISNGNPPPVKPAAPRALRLHAGDGSVTVTWAPPAPNHTAAVTRYLITASGRGRWYVSAAVRQLRVDGLADGRGYRITVQAVNGAGPGASAALVAVPVAAPARTPLPSQTVGEVSGAGVIPVLAALAKLPG
jgi:predicted phage tail protein